VNWSNLTEETHFDETYGKFEVEFVQWETDDKGVNNVTFRESVPLKSCQEDDFSKFDTPRKKTARMTEAVRPNLLCLSDYPKQLQGDYESDAGMNIQLLFRKCTDSSLDCKSDAQLSKYMANKYLMLHYNSKFFNQTEFDKNPIVSESVVD